MPQGPIPVQPIAYPSLTTTFNITADTVIKASPGTVISVSVLAAGAGPGAIYDLAELVTTPSAANQAAIIPGEIATRAINWKCLTGIRIVPSSGMEVAVQYQ